MSSISVLSLVACTLDINKDPSPSTQMMIPKEDSKGKYKPFSEEKLDRLVQQRKLFVFEPCIFEDKEYYLLSSKNVKEIYKNTENVMMTIQGVWGELKQYQERYNLGEPKQRRMQNFRAQRARGILLTSEFLIDLLNNEIKIGDDTLNVDE